MRVVGMIVLGLLAVAALRLSLQIALVIAGLLLLVALFRDPVRTTTTGIGCLLLLAVLSLPPVAKVLLFLAVSSRG